MAQLLLGILSCQARQLQARFTLTPSAIIIQSLSIHLKNSELPGGEPCSPDLSGVPSKPLASFIQWLDLQAVTWGP
jgi:hypothetical protein